MEQSDDVGRVRSVQVESSDQKHQSDDSGGNAIRLVRVSCEIPSHDSILLNSIRFDWNFSLTLLRDSSQHHHEVIAERLLALMKLLPVLGAVGRRASTVLPLGRDGEQRDHQQEKHADRYPD